MACNLNEAMNNLVILHKGAAFMKEKILKLLKLENLFENLSGYVESKIELFKFEIREEVVSILSKVLVTLIVAVCFFFFLTLASLGLAYYLGTLVGMAGGLLIVAGVYLLIFIFLIAFREQVSDGIHALVMNMSMAHKKDKDDDEASGKE